MDKERGGRENEQEESNEDEQDQEDDSLSTSITSLASNNSCSRRQSSTSSVLSPNAMGSLSHRPARALQSRSSFLGGRPSYVLYYWEVVDTHQIF